MDGAGQNMAGQPGVIQVPCHIHGQQGESKTF